MNANLPHLKQKYFVYFLISVVIFFIDTSGVLNAQSVHVGPAADDNRVKNGFGPIIVSEQSSDRTGIYYSACELGLKSGVSIQKLVFQLNDTSNLPYFSPGISVKLKNSTRCRLDAWNSWESATSGSVSMGVINPEIIVNGGGKFVIFIFSNPFSYSGKGIEMFFESTDTTHHPINFLTYQSPGNMQFWSGNLIAPENNNYKPIMDIELNQLNAQSLPSNANLEIKSCDNLYEVCLGEPICLTISPTANATVPLVVPPDLQVKWTFGTSNVQFSSGSTAANFDLIFNPGDAIKCQILSSTGLVLRTKTIFTTNWTILDNPNDPFVCFDDEPMGTEIGSRISEVVFAKKVNGQFMPMLRSLTDYEGVASYSLNVNPTLAFSNLQPLFSQYPPMINEYGTFTDFSNILQQSAAIPEVRIGDTLKFDLRMSKALKPAMFNHIAKMEVDWNADMLIDSSYYYSFDDGIPFFQVSPTSGLLYSTDMSNSDTIRYSRNVVVPITSTPNSTVRVLAELKKNPTGWDEREGYSIKILCQKPKIVVHGSGSFCAGDTLFASVYNPLNYALDYKWYKDGVLVATIASPVNYFIPASSGVYTVQADFVPNECAEFSNAVVITVNPLPSAPSVTNGSRCGSGSVNLGAIASSGAIVDWYNSLTGGVSFNSGINYSTPNLSSTATYYVEARNSSTGCVSSPRTAVVATVNSVPTSPVLISGSRCGSGTVNLSGSVPSGHVIDWYSGTFGGFPLSNGNNFTTPSITSTTNYYAVSRNLISGCISSPRTMVTATVNTVPSSPTVTNGSRCGSGTVTLGATALSGAIVDWYSSQIGAGLVNTGTVYTSPNLTTTTTYYVEARNSVTGCVSSPRVQVIATINSIVSYYLDNDGDGYGAGVANNLCSNPGAGYVTNNTDCNDSNASLNTISAETCNNFDDDCDGLVDDGLTFTNYYVDNDGDGFGAGAASNLCANPGAGYVTNNTDCNDSNSSLNSISAETCNSFDDDCDGLVDDGLSFINYYNDSDGDTYGAGSVTNACQSPGAGYVTNNTDCDDTNASLNSISAENCNNFDDDCNGLVDDGLSFVNYYNDADGDIYGAGPATNACQSPGASYVTNNTDCNDATNTVNPSVTETCNSIDDDCDGLTDEGCAAGSLIAATQITSLPQFGLTGGNYSQNVNMSSQTDTPEYGGTYPEKWFKFVAQSNAVRIAVTGASSADDNAIAIYDDPGLSYTTPLIPIDVADAVNLSSTGVTDQGNEILLTDQLVEGNTYYVVVATVNGTPGNINVKFNTLLPSSCDIAAYTGGTNTFSNVCNNFKCRYRQNAKQGVLHRWASNVIAGSPLQSYTIPPSSIMNTVCQLSKFVPANISGSAQTIYVSADVQYELPDAAGVIHYLTAISTSTCSFTLNAEPSINLRSTDACPNFKTTMSSLATDRSVCGTSQYQWEFTMAYPSPGLPTNVSGSVGGSRILAASSIPGIGNGQRYDVRIRALHNDAVTYSGWSASPSCFKTLGAAGMVPWSSEEEQKVDSENDVVSLYPNPSLQGKGALLRSSSTIESIQIFNSSGHLLAKANGAIEQGFLELPALADAGLYWVVVKTGDDIKRLAWLVQ